MGTCAYLELGGAAGMMREMTSLAISVEKPRRRGTSQLFEAHTQLDLLLVIVQPLAT
jgi:hypothetical protein